MKNKKLKRLALLNLISGYGLFFLFVLLVILNRAPDTVETIEVATPVTTEEAGSELFNGTHSTETIYIERDRSVGIDYGRGVVLDDEVDVLVRAPGVALVHNPDHVVIGDNDLIIGHDRALIGGNFNNERIVEGGRSGGYDRDVAVPVHGRGDRHDVGNRHVGPTVEGVVDLGLLEKAVRESNEKSLIDEDFGVDGDEVGNLTLAKDKNIDFDQKDLIETELGKDGYGPDKGDLHAYNYPSQGVGAGIGAPAIGAGVGSAGIGAGIGEAVLDGKTVPALGGVGTYSGAPKGGPALSPPTMGGVGGLVSGAGAGGARRANN